MAKFASIITLLFVALVLFSAFEAPIMVEAQESRPWEQSCQGHACGTGSGTESESQKSCARPSGTMPGPGVCNNNIACRNQCTKREGARHGSCNGSKYCICYFPC